MEEHNEYTCPRCGLPLELTEEDIGYCRIHHWVPLVDPGFGGELSVDTIGKLVERNRRMEEERERVHSDYMMEYSAPARSKKGIPVHRIIILIALIIIICVVCIFFFLRK